MGEFPEESEELIDEIVCLEVLDVVRLEVDDTVSELMLEGSEGSLGVRELLLEEGLALAEFLSSMESTS